MENLIGRYVHIEDRYPGKVINQRVSPRGFDVVTVHHTDGSRENHLVSDCEVFGGTWNQLNLISAR